MAIPARFAVIKLLMPSCFLVPAPAEALAQASWARCWAGEDKMFDAIHVEDDPDAGETI